MSLLLIGSGIQECPSLVELRITVYYYPTGIDSITV